MQDKQKRVRFVIGSLDIGGTENHLVQILPELMRQGISPIVITITHQGALAIKLIEQGIKVIAPDKITRIFQRIPLLSRLLGPLATIPYLLRTYRRYPAALNCFYLPSSYYLGMIAAMLAGESAKTVMFRRSLNHYQKKRPFVSRFERWLHKTPLAIVGNSQAVINQLADEEGVPRAKIRLIYNGIDHALYGDKNHRLDVRKELGIADRVLVLSIVANLNPYKGHRDLIDALALIAEKFTDPWFLLCIGSGIETRTDLLRQVKSHHLEPHIKWLGSRKDVPRLLMASDIGLQVSHQEGFSNSVLEGMASGLPLIVTDVGGNREAVIHEECGLVVPPHSPVNIAQAILTLSENRLLRAKYGDNARKRVASEFSHQACLANYLSLFETIK